MYGLRQASSLGNHYELRDLQPADLPAISEGLPTHFRFDGRPLEQLPRAAREILDSQTACLSSERTFPDEIEPRQNQGAATFFALDDAVAAPTHRRCA